MFLEGLSLRKAGESVANLCAASEATVKWVTSALLTKERQKERQVPCWFLCLGFITSQTETETYSTILEIYIQIIFLGHGPLSLSCCIYNQQNCVYFFFFLTNKCPFLNVISFNFQFANPQVSIAEDISTRTTGSFYLQCVRLLGSLNDVIWLKYLQKNNKYIVAFVVTKVWILT